MWFKRITKLAPFCANHCCFDSNLIWLIKRVFGFDISPVDHVSLDVSRKVFDIVRSIKTMLGGADLLELFAEDCCNIRPNRTLRVCHHRHNSPPDRFSLDFAAELNKFIATKVIGFYRLSDQFGARWTIFYIGLTPSIQP
jgi:hypothetical protein